MSREEFKKKVKRDAFVRADGRCEMILPSGDRCPCKLQPGRFIYDHRTPDFMGGDATVENCQVICTPCDKAKYVTDRAMIDKTRRQSDAHIGADSAPRQKIRSAGFRKAPKRHPATEPVSKLYEFTGRRP